MSVSGPWFEPPLSNTFPIAHLMRVAFPQHWVRIHALPQSKRYADSPAERDLVFARYAAFGSALLGDDAPVRIMQSCFAGSPSKLEHLPDLEWSASHRVEIDDGVWETLMAPTTWNPLQFRELLQAIADDEVAHVAFVSELSGGVFVPYDGGADGFSLDVARIEALKRQFSSWRSAHPLGL